MGLAVLLDPWWGHRPEMPLNIQQYTGQPPPQRLIGPRMSAVLRVTLIDIQDTSTGFNKRNTQIL